MIPLTFKPIDVWPEGWTDPNRRRKPSRFDAPLSTTRSELDTELRHLQATQAWLQVDASAGQVRNDGELRASAKIDFPGVILTIDSKLHGVLTYPCDTFLGNYQRPGWQHNLRAITGGLAALRKIERYGIADRGQQYAGFAALGAGTPMGRTEPMDPQRAARVLLEAAGLEVDATVDPVGYARPHVDALYKAAAKTYHPDSGHPLADGSVFGRITEARDALKGTR